jgi:hypothetical protein
MTPPTPVSPEFLLWAELFLIWSAATYGLTLDPLKEESSSLLGVRWLLIFSCRSVGVAAITYALSGSILLSSLLLLIAFFQPFLRFHLGMHRLAEVEGLWIVGSMALSFSIIRLLRLDTRYVPASVSSAQLAAICILAGTLLVVVRGGTYIVRGVLRKSSDLLTERRLRRRPALPRLSKVSFESDFEGSVTAVAASVEEPLEPAVDAKEYNRGRLIGDLERIVLTIVVAAGSYAALAFLVAAKSVVRFDEFENNRDFAEYFIIGSLSSVLVALCAGLALRFALLHLWPELLSLQMRP